MYFNITRESEIAVYGAGNNGLRILCALLKQGYRVNYIIDQNATHIARTTCVCPIKGLTDNMQENIVVFICVGNVFSHEEIAEELYDHGYNKIVYFPQNHDISYMVSMRQAFQCMTQCDFTGILNVPEYKCAKVDDAVIFEDDHSISLWYDKDKIFCIERKANGMNWNSIWARYENKHIEKLSIYFDFFRYLFSGEEDIKSIREYINFQREEFEHFNENEFLSQKKKIFLKYENAIRYDPYFFIMSPARCVCDKKNGGGINYRWIP